MSGVLPGGALDVIRDQLTRLAAQGSEILSISFVVGLVSRLLMFAGWLTVNAGKIPWIPPFDPFPYPLQ
jgi:uncharacterized BrkB/YihY/UPF0761 family membrane protein